MVRLKETMPRTEQGWRITAEELEAWTIFEDARLWVVDKPAHVLCYPSKHGPWSSLIGAGREWLGLERLHMPSRLDRETSGVVVFAKDAETGSRVQTAVQRQEVRKVYVALLRGRLSEAVRVEQGIGLAEGALVRLRRCVRADGERAVTHFEPLARGGGYTLARVRTETGRTHQIRVHAEWLGCPVAGDKIYGGDGRHFLEFIEHGWTEALAAALPFDRQALHCEEWAYGEWEFRAPAPAEWRRLTQAGECGSL